MPAKVSCTVCDLIACGSCIIPVLIDQTCWFLASILRSIRGGKTENSLCQILIVRLLKNIWWLVLLLVWVIPYELPGSLTFVSPVVAVFNSYPTSFIVMLATALTSLFEFTSFSLANIAFKLFLCKLNARLNVSVVTLLASAIDSYFSSLVTWSISHKIFTFDNGVMLCSLW